MVDICHRVGIAAPAAEVYERLSTIAGLETWWTRRVEGDPALGGTLDFFFGGPEPSAVMRVDDAQPNRAVRWRCVGGPDEWVGTDVEFDLTTEGDETVVMFRHAHWREPVAFMHHCATKWGYFLLSLKAGLEGDKSTPFPDDLKISSWG
jgi:uncharacterized protein YndB with AHSA1/START domain